MDNLSAEKNNKINEEIIKDAAALSGTLYFSQALYMLRGFIIAHVLGPSTYGVWSIFRTVFNSAPFLGFGAQEAMLREVPFSIGEGNKQRAPIIIQTSLSWNIFISSFVMVIAVILSFMPFIKEYNSEIRFAGVVFVLNGIHLFMQPKLKSEKRIVLLSKYLLAYAVLNFIFGLSFLFLLEINGLLLGMLASHLMLFAFMISKGLLSFRFSLDRKVLKELLNIGFPIMIISSVFFLMRNVDKFIVIALLGKKTAGYYGLAAFLSNAVRYVSYSTSSALLPRAMHAYGKTKNIKDLELYYTKPITVMAGFIPVILGLLFINIAAIVNLLLQQYIPSITVLQIFIIGLFFTTIWGPPINILIALKKHQKLMYINAILLLCGIIMEIAVIQIGFGISGVAVVVTCMFMIASVIANTMALSLLKDNAGQIWKSLGMLYLPFLYSLGGLLLISLLPESQESIIDEAVKSLVYFLYCIPLFLYTEKKSGIIGKIFSAAKNIRK